MKIIATFIAMLIGVLLMPALASGVAAVIANANISGTPAAAVVGAILTIYAILVLYSGARALGAV